MAKTRTYRLINIRGEFIKKTWLPEYFKLKIVILKQIISNDLGFGFNISKGANKNTFIYIKKTITRKMY